MICAPVLFIASLTYRYPLPVVRYPLSVFGSTRAALPPLGSAVNAQRITDNGQRTTDSVYEVMAPCAADDTSRAYFAMTPFAYRGGFGVQAPSRDAISASGSSTSSRREGTSKTTMSPSRRAAMGPPRAASGAT